MTFGSREQPSLSAVRLMRTFGDGAQQKIALLESKYRAVPKPYLERIGTLGYDDLLALVVRIPNATSMESLFPSTST